MNKIERITQMLQTNPKDAFLRHALGLELIKIGSLNEAVHNFENLLEDEPTYVGSYYHLGKTFEQLNLIEKAVDVYQKGMKIAKQVNDQHAYNELQQVYELLND